MNDFTSITVAVHVSAESVNVRFSFGEVPVFNCATSNLENIPVCDVELVA